MLFEMLVGRDPPPDAAVLFARREGKELPARARGFLLAAHERAPANAEVLEALVLIEVEQGYAAAALARLNRLVAARQAGPRTLLLRARLHVADGDYDAAEADVLRAFEADPGLPGAVDLLFEIYEAQGRLAEARRSFEQAEAAGVLHSGARLLLGRLYLADGDTEGAARMFEQVVAEQPRIPDARRDLARVLAMRGEDLDRALELARQVEAVSRDDPESVDVVGSVHLRAGRNEAALAHFRRAVRLATAASADGRLPSYQYHLGLALRALGRDAEAARAFEQALGHGADFPEAEEARRLLEAPSEPPAATPSAS
jgi:tetratricopeptide (TPR) repeat protein